AINSTRHDNLVSETFSIASTTPYNVASLVLQAGNFLVFGKIQVIDNSGVFLTISSIACTVAVNGIPGSAVLSGLVVNGTAKITSPPLFDRFVTSVGAVYSLQCANSGILSITATLSAIQVDQLN